MEKMLDRKRYHSKLKNCETSKINIREEIKEVRKENEAIKKNHRNMFNRISEFGTTLWEKPGRFHVKICFKYSEFGYFPIIFYWQYLKLLIKKTKYT